MIQMKRKHELYGVEINGSGSDRVKLGQGGPYICCCKIYDGCVVYGVKTVIHALYIQIGQKIIEGAEDRKGAKKQQHLILFYARSLYILLCFVACMTKL